MTMWDLLRQSMSYLLIFAADASSGLQKCIQITSIEIRIYYKFKSYLGNKYAGYSEIIVEMRVRFRYAESHGLPPARE